MKPTGRCILLFALGFPVALVPVLVNTQLWSIWLALFAMSLSLAALDGLLAHSGQRPRCELRAPSSLYIGASDELELTVELRGRTRREVELAIDVNDYLEPIERRTLSLTQRATKTSIQLTPTRRGIARIERVWLRWHGPMRLMARTTTEHTDKAVPIIPNTRSVHAAALQFSSEDAIAGIKVDRQPGTGSEFDALREYVTGMDHRAIDWKQSARHRKLICKEYRTERNHNVVIAIDSGQLMSNPLTGVPKLDHAINCALLLSYLSLRTGDVTGLASFDTELRKYTAPRAGVAAFSQIQQVASEIDYREVETNYTLSITQLAERLRRRSLVVVLTDFVDTVTADLMIKNIGHLARRHVVLFVALRDPRPGIEHSPAPTSVMDVHQSVIANQFAAEREKVIERLRQLGAHCIDTAPTELIPATLNSYLDIKRRELV